MLIIHNYHVIICIGSMQKHCNRSMIVNRCCNGLITRVIVCCMHTADDSSVYIFGNTNRFNRFDVKNWPTIVDIDDLDFDLRRILIKLHHQIFILKREHHCNRIITFTCRVALRGDTSLSVAVTLHSMDFVVS